MTGQPIIYEIRVHSEPVNNEFTFYVNGTGYTTDSEGMFTVTGTTEHRVANMTIINTTGMRLPETGSSITLLLILAALMIGVTVIFRKKDYK